MKNYKIEIDELEFDQVYEKALNSEPDFLLSENFSEQLRLKLQKQNILQIYLQEFLIYCSVFIVIISLTVAMMFWIDSNIWDQIQLFIQQQYVSIIGINLLLVFILFVDKVLLRYFYFRTNEKQFLT